MGAPVIIFQHQEPRQRLMAWFLKDSGIHAALTSSIEETLELISSQSPRVIVLNTMSPNTEVAEIVKTLRIATADARIIVLHAGKHRPDEPEILADACVHDVSDPDALVETVRAAINDELPDIEPHDAAEEVAAGE